MTGEKRILAIRHGESAWNFLASSDAATEEEKYHPKMVDCDITNVGNRQGKEAGINLGRQISSIDLLLISPLRRALQTASRVLETFPGGEPSNVEICKNAAEVYVDPCDIGSSPVALQHEFPGWNFSHLEECWWHGGKNPKDSLVLMKDRQGLEEEETVHRRVQALKCDLRARPEQTIVIVCHSDIVWWLTSEMKNGERFGVKLDNGEILNITSHVLNEKDE